MRHLPSLARTFKPFVLAIGLVLTICAVRSRAEGSDSVGIIHFDAPAGWKAIDQPGKAIRMYVPPDGTKSDQAIIIVASGDSGSDFRAQFDQLVKGAMASRKVMQSGQVRSGTSRQGFPVLSENVTAEGNDGQMVMARFVAANVNGRPAFLCYIATLPDAYENFHPAIDKLLGSVSFGDSPVASTVDQGKAQAAAANDVAQKTPEQWARQADRRRKAHTILGDILNTQGQPTKGLKGSVYVGGTTIRGDRTSYQVEIDENGHFEMLVPDGVYRLSPTLSVDYDGKSMPVQLEAVDGKSPGQSFGSADGIVRDYRWVLLGRQPGTQGDSYVNYFGAHLSLADTSPGGWGHEMKDRWPAGTKLRMVFTPTGPLIDGSEGRPIAVEMDLKMLGTPARQGFATVPIGVYKAAGELVTPDGRSQSLGMSLQPGNNARASEVEIHFSQRGFMQEVNDVIIWISDAAR